MARGLFRCDGVLFLPSELTRGGWDDVSQHGGPPCGLLGRAVETVPTAVPMQVVRLTVDLFRAVPLAPLRVETSVVREGRRIQLVDASLWAGQTELGRARALKIRIGDVGIPDPEADSMPVAPDLLPRLDWRGHFGEGETIHRFHYDGAEVRTLDDSFITPGPGLSWVRLLQPLVEGETDTPFVRVATLADFGNGNSQVLDPRVHTFVNPDISLHLEREPRGEWIGMRSVAHPWRHGIGMAESVLYDEKGRIGRVIQSQVIEER